MKKLRPENVANRTALVAFLFLKENTWHKQFKTEKIHFNTVSEII